MLIIIILIIMSCVCTCMLVCVCVCVCVCVFVCGWCMLYESGGPGQAGGHCQVKDLSQQIVKSKI